MRNSSRPCRSAPLGRRARNNGSGSTCGEPDSVVVGLVKVAVACDSLGIEVLDFTREPLPDGPLVCSMGWLLLDEVAVDLAGLMSFCAGPADSIDPPPRILYGTPPSAGRSSLASSQRSNTPKSLRSVSVRSNSCTDTARSWSSRERIRFWGTNEKGEDYRKVRLSSRPAPIPAVGTTSWTVLKPI